MLSRLLADIPHAGLPGATVAYGMGGAGKSILAASLVRHPAVRSRFQHLCWLPIGQTPDMRRVLAMLHGQLVQVHRSVYSDPSPTVVCTAFYY